MSAIRINYMTDERPGTDETVSILAIEELCDHGVEVEMVWAIDHNMLPGMNSFEDEGVEWPARSLPMLQSRVLVIGHPG